MIAKTKLNKPDATKEELITEVGAGLKPQNHNLERAKLLLAENNAGNDGGFKEFTTILKKLLKLKAISKKDYNNFINSWRK